MSQVTLRDLLTNPTTPAEMLRTTKNLAKGWMRANGGLPHDISLVIYLASIAALTLHHGGGATRLNDDELNHHANWALAQQWIDLELRTFLRRGLKKSE